MSQPSVIRLTDRAVRDEAVERLEAHIPVAVAGYECTTDMVWDVLIKAAVTKRTVEAVVSGVGCGHQQYHPHLSERPDSS